MNAFVNEARDARLSVNVDGLAEKLRCPETLHRLLMLAKPATTSVGDFCLKSMLDNVLMAAIMRSDYRAVYGTLVTIFGAEVTTGHPEVTSVTCAGMPVTNGPVDATKRYAKAQGRTP